MKYKSNWKIARYFTELQNLINLAIHLVKLVFLCHILSDLVTTFQMMVISGNNIVEVDHI